MVAEILIRILTASTGNFNENPIKVPLYNETVKTLHRFVLIKSGGTEAGMSFSKFERAISANASLFLPDVPVIVL